MQQLMIMRHAKAAPPHPGVEDFPRALVDTGRDDAEKVARWISESLQLPDDILCSPAQRTRETLAPLLTLRPELESCTSFIPQLYGASAGTLSVLLDSAFATHQRVLLVGHNPGIENLACDTVAPSERSRIKRLQSGTLLVVEFATGWPDAAGQGQLTHMVRGRSL